MKNIITAFIFLTTLPMYGQTHFIGIKGGINWNNVNTVSSIYPTKFRNAFTAGMSYEYKFKTNFNIELEVLYTQRGFTNEALFTDQFGNPIGNNTSIGYHYDYIALPIKGGYSIGNNLKGFINLGVVPALIVDANLIFPELIGGGNKHDITKDVTAFDLGGLIELGANYKLKENYFLFTSIGLQKSFTSLTNDHFFPTYESKLYGVTLSAGLKYALN
jgi:hypothetical protein